MFRIPVKSYLLEYFEWLLKLIEGQRRHNLLSLFPRLFLPPDFDHLQYAYMDREGLGDLVMCNDIRW